MPRPLPVGRLHRGELTALLGVVDGLNRDELRDGASTDASPGASACGEAAGLTTHVGGQIIPSDVPGSLSMGIRQPAGVVIGMAPWNAPVILSTRAVAFPLAAGNTVVLKCSELSPATPMLLGGILVEAGLGGGIVNVISVAPQDAGEVTEAIVAHPAVRRLNSSPAPPGSAASSARSAPVTLCPRFWRLGGKNPLLVLNDADIDAAVQGATFGGFVNQGHDRRSSTESHLRPASVQHLTGRRLGQQQPDPGESAWTNVGS